MNIHEAMHKAFITEYAPYDLTVDDQGVFIDRHTLAAYAAWMTSWYTAIESVRSWDVVFSVLALNTEAAETMPVYMEREGKLPFFPATGQVIDCGDGNYRKVVEVMWSAETKELNVQFEDEPRSTAVMESWGWKDATQTWINEFVSRKVMESWGWKDATQ